jgi:hypothetical protein|tara:strand:- start:8815 stop:9285 length:471 start_codon:yes stop_codon:yes gene_type:complete
MSVNPAFVVDAPFYSTEFGEFLSSKTARFQEILHDYNPYLELVFIPSSKRDSTDTHPYALRDNSPWRGGYIIKHMTEAELEHPERILAWLWEGDLSKHSLVDVMKRTELKRMAEEAMDLKKEQDIAAERQELATALLSGGQDKKHFFRHNGKTFRR